MRVLNNQEVALVAGGVGQGFQTSFCFGSCPVSIDELLLLAAELENVPDMSET